MKVYIVIRRILDTETIVGDFRTLDAAKIGTKGYARISAHDSFRVEEYEITEDAAEDEAAWRAMMAKAPAEWTKAEAAMWEAKFQAAHARAEKQLANNRRIFHDR
jgi:hypothetical protein